MRYLLLRYLRRPNGKMDEEMTVAKHLRLKDHQCSAVILDFKTGKVVQASLEGRTVPKDFDRIVQYYHQYYASTIDSLLQANGWTDKLKQPDTAPGSALSKDGAGSLGPGDHRS